MLENIKTPEDIKKFSDSELEKLAGEVRAKIIDTVSNNGGHLGSNLGLVEATLVIHKLFNIPEDKLIFDVGHQCYTHKLLTGRYDSFDSLRKGGGISGFTNRFESEYDAFTAGHSGSAISASLGVATADKLAGKNNYTVVVVGDGSFTNGMVYEALNNCNNKDVNLIIILNDNEMSISQNVGSLAGYLSKIRTSGTYYYFKRVCHKIFGKIPLLGKLLLSFTRHIKNGFKRLFYKQPFFEPLGVKYLGPVDGNDIDRLETVLKEAKRIGRCTLVHIKTKKGYGYKYAEDMPENYHSVSAFDPDSGVSEGGNNDFSSEFGRIMCEKAEKDEKVCAITSAMRDGTGLARFSESFPDRFFDVGIAEEHEIAFAGGLASSGMMPVCALYSTFAQRTYDQLIHDVSLQKLHIVLALDRAGIVQGDFVSDIPNTEIYSPDSFDEMRTALDAAFASDKISVVRYPKGKEASYDRDSFVSHGAFSVCDSFAKESVDVVIVTYGSITKKAYETAKKLSEDGIGVRIIKLFKVHPVCEYCDELAKYISGAGHIYFAEEGIKNGGISQKLIAELSENGKLSAKTLIRAVDGFYPVHGSVDYVRQLCGFDVNSMTCEIKEFVK